MVSWVAIIGEREYVALGGVESGFAYISFNDDCDALDQFFAADYSETTADEFNKAYKTLVERSSRRQVCH